MSAPGVLVELGVERDDTAIGLDQLARVDPRDLGLALPQLLEGGEQFLVLLLDLIDDPLRDMARQLGRDARQVLGPRRDGPRGQVLGHHDAGARRLLRLDLEPVHQPARPDNADAEPGLRDIPAVHDRLEVADARPALADADRDPDRRPLVDLELDAAPAGVLEGVAGDLGRGGRDARLVELGKSQQARDLAGSLPRQHDVGLEADLDGQQRPDAHASCPPRGHEYGHVVPLAPVVAVQQARDQRGCRIANPGCRDRSHRPSSPSEWSRIAASSVHS